MGQVPEHRPEQGLHRVVAQERCEQLVVVAQGGGGHQMFDAEWIRAQDQMEYPFALAEALAYKFGYRTPNRRQQSPGTPPMGIASASSTPA